MAAYTMEDVELIRSRSGMTYEEAVTLLDYHSGDVVRALVDLEKRGRLRDGGKTGTEKETKTVEENKGGNKFMNFIQKLYRTRVKVRKGNTIIANLSVLYMILAVLIFSPHLAILSLILGLILGYQINIDPDDEAFREEKVESIVRGAADNVKQAVNDISREISSAVEREKQKQAEKTEKAAEPVKARADEIRVQPADPNREILQELAREQEGPSVPTIQMPIRVESSEGQVEVTEEPGGYHSVTVG